MTKATNSADLFKSIKDGFVPAEPADLEDFNSKELLSLFNRLAAANGQPEVKKFADRKSGIKRTLKMFEKFGALAKTKKSSKKSGPTKYDLLRAVIPAVGETVTMDALMEASGFDRKNTSVAMAILRNPSRTPNPVITKYDRKTSTFTVIKK